VLVIALSVTAYGCIDGPGSGSDAGGQAGGMGGAAGGGGLGGAAGAGGHGGAAGAGGTSTQQGPTSRDLVSAGLVSSSPGHRVVWSVGQSTMHQGKCESSSSRYRGGLIAAME
jgi:hypothetical protein